MSLPRLDGGHQSRPPLKILIGLWIQEWVALEAFPSEVQQFLKVMSSRSTASRHPREWIFLLNLLQRALLKPAKMASGRRLPKDCSSRNSRYQYKFLIARKANAGDLAAVSATGLRNSRHPTFCVKLRDNCSLGTLGFPASHRHAMSMPVRNVRKQPSEFNITFQCGRLSSVCLL